ncbi:MAG: thiamine phosphate synthase [Bacteroidetes bacterium]|nr:thiamine phosphate synthase [Bacteroidota bacterium]
MKGSSFDFRLYLVTDRSIAVVQPLERLVELAIEGGVTAIQVREKDASTREFIDIARRVKTVLTGTNVPLIINDRVDVALAVDADGVHIGQSDMPYHDVRKILGPTKIIGLSVETPEQAQEAETLDVDYLGVSPIFPTPTKTDVQTSWGLEGLQRLRTSSRHLLIAIGGINASNAAAVLKAGADGIAVVSAICSNSDPRHAAHELRKIIDIHCGRTP